MAPTLGAETAVAGTVPRGLLIGPWILPFLFLSSISSILINDIWILILIW